MGKTIHGVCSTWIENYSNSLHRSHNLPSKTHYLHDMIDLHLHSTYSDGTMPPKELVEKAAGIGLTALSITDHDTIAGTQEALTAGKVFSVEVIPGLEISSKFRDINLHLLGYQFNWQDRRLAEVLKRLQGARSIRNLEILSKLQSLGLEISEQDLIRESGNGVAGRPHFARLLVKCGVVKNNDQAFAQYLKKGRCAYAPRFLLDVEEAIDIIHGAGGIAILAHPIQLPCSFSELSEIIRQLKIAGLDGLESYYPTQKGKIGKRIKDLARTHQLLETGGSDYHGDVRPNSSMAGETGKFQVPDDLLAHIKAYQGHPGIDTKTT